MNLPPTDSDIAFEQLLQELPEEYEQLAREFKAFCRGRKIKSPADLLRLVLSYCGLDQVLREVAGTCTLRDEAISDTAIHKRLKACLPWVKVLLTRMMGEGLEGLIAGNLRLVVIDGSTVVTVQTPRQKTGPEGDKDRRSWQDPPASLGQCRGPARHPTPKGHAPFLTRPFAARRSLPA